ncbi:hypothetical protein BGW80DRAFT_1442562 [Lactifluus volemus]|nr:hypothetical protein BGW80DRAFT_1442562 [Lactifluus volemus]
MPNCARDVVASHGKWVGEALRVMDESGCRILRSCCRLEPVASDPQIYVLSVAAHWHEFKIVGQPCASRSFPLEGPVNERIDEPTSPFLRANGAQYGRKKRELPDATINGVSASLRVISGQLSALLKSRKVVRRMIASIESRLESEDSEPLAPPSTDLFYFVYLMSPSTADFDKYSFNNPGAKLPIDIELRRTNQDRRVPSLPIPYRRDPIVVHQTLCESSNLQEILWNFSRYKGKKRLTLKENPHFYEHLPCLPEAYGNTFKANAIQDFQHVEKVYVLTDKVGRVYVETQAQDIRAFGNFWIPSNAIIFKDIHGMLEGERHVERSIDATPKIWYRKEHPLPPLPTPPVNSTSVVTMPVWKQVIRLTVDDRDIDIRISTRPLELDDGWLLSQLTTPSTTADEATIFSSGTTADTSTVTSCTSTHFPSDTWTTRQRASAQNSSLVSHAPQEPPRAPLQDVPAHTSAKTFEPPQLHLSERHPSITSPKFQELPTPHRHKLYQHTLLERRVDHPSSPPLQDTLLWHRTHPKNHHEPHYKLRQHILPQRHLNPPSCTPLNDILLSSPKFQELPTPSPPQAVPAHTSPMASKPSLQHASARHSPMTPPAPHELLAPAPPHFVPSHSPTVPRPLQQRAEGEGHAPRQTVVSGTKPGNPTTPAPSSQPRNLNWFRKYVWDY